MTLDMNQAAPEKSGDLIPDGTYARVALHIRPGGVDGDSEADRGLLKPSTRPGSDVLSLDAEFTVLTGPYARRRFWQLFTVKGGKCDAEGQSIGWKISLGQLRALLDSSLGLAPDDCSETAHEQRVLRGLVDLNGREFAAKIRVEPSRDPAYRDANRLDEVVPATAPEWRRIMDGETVPAQPSSMPRAADKLPQAAAQSAPEPAAQTAAQPAAPRAEAGPGWVTR